MIVHE